MKIFKNKEDAIKAAVEKFGHLAIQTQTVNVIKIGPMIARHLGCHEGWAIESIGQDNHTINL